MFTHKKHLAFALLLCANSPLFAKQPSKDFQKSAATFGTNTLEYTKCAVIAAIQSFDYLLYPALCFGVGRSVYKNHVSPRLMNTPEFVKNVEDFIPGGSTARHFATYLAVGSALIMAVNKLTNTPSVHSFMETNMPNSFHILDYLKSQLSKTNVSHTQPSNYNKDTLIYRN